MHANSADQVTDDTKHGISDARKRNIVIHSPSRMDVERSFKAQRSLGEVYEAPIKRLNDRIAGGIYNDKDELDKMEYNLDKLQRSKNQCLEDAQQMEEFNSLFGVVKAGSGLRKGRDNFSLDWALIDLEDGRTGEILNQVSRSMGYLFQLFVRRNFKISLISTPHINPLREIVAELSGLSFKILKAAKFSSLMKGYFIS